MKKTVTKKDGTVVVYEGTPQEIHDLEDLKVPKKHVDPKEFKLPPDFAEKIRKAVEGNKQAGKQFGGGLVITCPACNGQPWFGTIPPQCICGKNLKYTTISSGSVSATIPNYFGCNCEAGQYCKMCSCD